MKLGTISAAAANFGPIQFYSGITTYLQVNLDLKLLLCDEYNLKGMSFEMVRPYCLEAEEVGLNLSTISNLIVIKEEKTF